MTFDEEVQKSDAAQRILDDPTFIAACNSVRDQLQTQRLSVATRDVEMHTRLILAEQVWDLMMSWLKNAVDTGKMAKLELERRSSLKLGPVFARRR